YHSIDECIRLGRKRFEPGAGGEHKIARGFEPQAIHSAHLIFDRRLGRAIRAFCEEERAEHQAILANAEQIAGLRPWTR
ncbi:MAG TPA: peptidogalycan biosysnthesis protein, partial [Myxococcaceae bacterium]|nr:peptidogalycan biosysnthesis protein [Myxococcaceae bacterium]